MDESGVFICARYIRAVGDVFYVLRESVRLYLGERPPLAFRACAGVFLVAFFACLILAYNACNRAVHYLVIIIFAGRVGGEGLCSVTCIEGLWDVDGYSILGSFGSEKLFA